MRKAPKGKVYFAPSPTELRRLLDGLKKLYGYNRKQQALNAGFPPGYFTVPKVLKYPYLFTLIAKNTPNRLLVGIENWRRIVNEKLGIDVTGGD